MDEEEVRTIISQVNREPFGVSGHKCIIADMIQAIQQERVPIVSGKEGRDALSLVVACQMSAEQGKAIMMSDLTGGTNL